MSESHEKASRIRVAIVGAGVGGLCMGIRLKEAGFEDFVLLEKSDGVGGTWYHNRYPGCACDLPSQLYSFSFEIKRDWSRPYAPQSEILEYLESVAIKYGLLPHCRFGTAVKAASWDERRSRWRIVLETDDALDADVLVSAVGMFNEVVWPDIDGLDRFRGTIFHSARWRTDHDLTEKRVAVIGSAASAVQIVPEIVKSAERVHLFQRTANWVSPKEDEPYTSEQMDLFRANPTLILGIRQQIFDEVDRGMTFSDPRALAEREAAVRLAMEVIEDPAVRAKLMPQHPFGCMRPLFSNDYYASFNRPNLELVTDPIGHVSADGVVTTDGRERVVDTLILATGFAATRYVSALDVRGRRGRSIEEAWKEGACAYLGVATAGFPNLFMLYGPNTNNGSIITMIEAQAECILQLIQRLDRERLAWIDVRAESMERYNDEVQDAIKKIAVWQADCNGYYRSPSGRVVTQWPFSMSEFHRRAKSPDPEAFEVAPRAVPSVSNPGSR